MTDNLKSKLEETNDPDALRAALEYAIDVIEDSGNQYIQDPLIKILKILEGAE